jgi:hypothetical protein
MARRPLTRRGLRRREARDAEALARDLEALERTAAGGTPQRPLDVESAAQVQGIEPERMQAASIGDVIFVRQAYVANVRILREELIHVHQQRAGIEVSRESITTGELMARYELIRNRHRWGLTRPEIREVVQEIRILRRTGRY